MATGTGLDGQIGFVAESAYGTAATVTRFLPFISESLAKQVDRIESKGQFTGGQTLRSTQWAAGNVTCGGNVKTELYTQSMGLLFRAAFGTVNTAGTAVPYTHTFWPTTPGVSFTTQVGRPATYGSVHPFTYQGCKINKWELSAKAGETVGWSMDVVAQEELMGTALASASYASNLIPWYFTSCSLSVAGASIPVTDFTVGGENSLADKRRFLGSGTISEPLRAELANFTGKISTEWGTPSGQGTLNYLRFTGGTESALVFTMASGTLSGTVTANIRYDGSTPNLGGRGIVMHDIPFKCIASGTLDSTAIQVQLVNNDSTA